MSDNNKSLSIILKRGYAPIEQYISRGEQGPWTDIYAVATTIYRMITGKKPPEATERVINDRLKLPSALGIEISKKSEETLIKALAINKEDRFHSMEKFLLSLHNDDIRLQIKDMVDETVLLDNETQLVVKNEAVKQNSKKQSKKMHLTIIGVVGLIIIGCLFIVSLNNNNISEITKNSKNIVPDFISKSEEHIQKIIEKKKLKLIIERVYSDSVKKGAVIKQSIQPGELVSKDEVIIITISKGNEKVIVPNITGITKEEAKNRF